MSSAQVCVGPWSVSLGGVSTTERFVLGPFRAPASREPDLSVEVVPSEGMPAGEAAVLEDGTLLRRRGGTLFVSRHKEAETPLVMALLQLASESAAVVAHSSAVQVRGRAVLAVGTSGAGKSTLATLAAPYPLLSDEFNVVWKRDGELVASATPLRSSSPREPNNITAPLGAILFPVKASEERLVPVPPDRAIEQLAQQVVTPQVFGLKPPFRLVAEIARRVPAYEFHFRKDPACVRLFDELKLAGE